jgi:hypothetical protein
MAESTLSPLFKAELRHGGRQYVPVEHVYVNDGGQAVVGNVGAPSGSVVVRKAVLAEMGGDVAAEPSADILAD